MLKWLIEIRRYVPRFWHDRIRQISILMGKLAASGKECRMTADNPRTGRIREVPLKRCSACGGTWFRVADFYAFWREETLGAFWETWPELVGKNSLALMGTAICLCGTPQRPSIGGIRGGRTPNHT